MPSLNNTRLSLLVVFFSLSSGLAAHAATNLVKLTTSGALFTFSPTNITINSGDTIKWTNTTAIAHDSTHHPTNGTLPGTFGPQLWHSALFSNSPPVNSFSFTFTNAGLYPYFCQFHSLTHMEQTGNVTVVTANLPPQVSIFNPTNGTAFFDPASFTIHANATDDGSVTQVQFFSGTNFLGVSTTTPYSNNVAALSAGSYALTAVATDNLGAKATSSVVNVTVTAPPNITLSLAQRLADGTFSFRVSGGSAGQTCIVDASDALPIWTSILTTNFPNTVCPICPFIDVTNNTSGLNYRFYRTRVSP